MVTQTLDNLSVHDDGIVVVDGLLSIAELHVLAYELRFYYLLQLFSCVAFGNDTKTQLIFTKKDAVPNQAPQRQNTRKHKGPKKLIGERHYSGSVLKNF